MAAMPSRDALTPNTPAKRLGFIAKTYERQPIVVLSMIDIIAHTVGEDEWRTAVRRASEADPLFGEDFKRYDLPFPDRLGLYWEPPPAYMRAVVELVQELDGFRRRTPAEAMFPWMATQLARSLKEGARAWARYGATNRPAHTHEHFRQPFVFLRNSGTALGQWFADTRPDLGRMSLDDVRVEFEDWQEDQRIEQGKLAIPQGEIVFKFDDGYTIQKLTTDEQLDKEGDVMQHCVGSYCAAVRRGDSVIYSLRDPKGKPHVTIEFDPGLRMVKQVKGKQNDDPAPKYQEYVDRFLESDVLPKMSPLAKEVLAALESHGGWDDDEWMRYEVEKWIEEFGDDAPAWARLFHRSEDAAPLYAEGLTPDEMARWPRVLWRPIIDEELRRSDYEEYVRVAKLAMLLHDTTRKPSRAAQEYMKQSSFGFSAKSERPIIELPSRWSFDEAEEEEEEWGPILQQAEAWDNVTVDGDEIEEWVAEGFAPEQAEVWSEQGVIPEIASVLRFYGVYPSQVEAAVDAGRLRDLYRLRKASDAEVILSAVGVTPNRRRL
jgi:hypothetical protein